MPDYNKVNAGDPVIISAEVWNDILSQLANNKNSGPARPSQRTPNAAPAGDVITVRNDTGANILRGRVVGLNDVVVGPTVGQDVNNDPDGSVAEFLRLVVMTSPSSNVNNNGTAINDPDAAFGVTLDSIPMGQFGRVMVSGLVQVRVNVQTLTDKRVAFATSTGVAYSTPNGSTRLVWVAGRVGSANQTGEQWGIIRLGGGSAVYPRATKYMVWQQLDDAGTWGPGFAVMH